MGVGSALLFDNLLQPSFFYFLEDAAPPGDAVTLVHHKQGKVDLLYYVDKNMVLQPFCGYIKECEE